VNNWTDWEVVRHRVAIAGRVVDSSGKPAAATQITVTALPKKSRQKTDRAASTAGADPQRGDEPFAATFAKADGIFYFLDLPAGRYTLKGIDQRSGLQDQKVVSVSWDQSGKVKRVADLTLPKA